MKSIRQWMAWAVNRYLDAVSLDQLRVEIGRIHAQHVRALPIGPLHRAEFKAFSQWGEDGIIQYLLGKVPISNETFVEFGVESYAEANTRFLVTHDNWRGAIIDGGSAHQDYANRHGLTWKHDLQVISAFITRDNINGLLSAAGIEGDIGLLSVDIDGNDYWVLEAIDVISPRILVVEYNALFGREKAVTIPYRDDFARTAAHFSNLYYGASLTALATLAERKGYRLVGCNSAGNNAFFVRDDVAGDLPVLSPSDAFFESRFCESRNRNGTLSYLRDRSTRLHLLKDLPLIDLTTMREGRIAEFFADEMSP